MDILLTGTSGFVGRHLAAALTPEHRVIPLNRKPTGVPGEIVHDFAEPLPFDRLPIRIDTVVHTAGLVGHRANVAPLCRRVNVDATRELAEYAVRAHAKRFVFLSTGGVYQPTEQRLTEQSNVAPQDAYTQSKHLAEIVLHTFENDLSVQILRLFFPFGPTQEGRLIPNLVERITQGKPIRLANALGQPLLTPTYIDDVVEYVRLVLLVSGSFVANLAGVEVVSIRTLAEMIGRVSMRSVSFEIQPDPLVCNWWGANELISTLTKYAPRVSLQLGIERTIAAAPVMAQR